ncbi:MAG: PilZ domain-containing protein [Nitrospinae bacterium]|nr:PilZ domain-containing protein [Nitrospinota bacterium]
METNSANESTQMRDSVRVDVSFPVTFTLVNEKDYEDLKNFILSHRTGDREGDITPYFGAGELESLDPTLVKIWLSMNSKLDYVINILRRNETGGKEKEGLCKDISGKGIKMLYKGDLSAGQYIQLRIHPPTFPPFTIIAVGKVLRAEKSALCTENEIEAAIEFDAIHGDDREEIVSYVFKRQRELLRAKKEV